jgi:hypothetical protein
MTLTAFFISTHKQKNLVLIFLVQYLGILDQIITQNIIENCVVVIIQNIKLRKNKKNKG